jgi:hypothetical protein
LFPPQTWTLPNILLANETYRIHVWDEDGGLFGSDDDLGEISFAGNGASGNATGTVGGSTGTLNVDYVIFQTPINPIITTDTIHVYPSVPTPVISAPGSLSFCEGDSVVFSSSATEGNQWFVDGTILTDDTNQTYVATQSGLYSVTVTNSYGCSASVSATDTVHVYDNPPNPTIFIAGDTLKCLITGYDFQWLINDTAIAGETNYYFVPSYSGNYSVVLITDEGCSDTSQVLFYTFTGINSVSNSLSDVLIYPNPANKTLHIESQTSGISIIRLTDLSGKIVFEKEFTSASNHLHETIDVSILEKGIYFLELKSSTNNIIRKISVN